MKHHLLDLIWLQQSETHSQLILPALESVQHPAIHGEGLMEPCPPHQGTIGSGRLLCEEGHCSLMQSHCSNQLHPCSRGQPLLNSVSHKTKIGNGKQNCWQEGEAMGWKVLGFFVCFFTFYSLVTHHPNKYTKTYSYLGMSGLSLTCVQSVFLT